MEPEMRLFLEEGIPRYAAATATLKTFSVEMARWFELILQQRQDWQSFTPIANATGVSTSSGSWTAAYIHGNSGQLELSINLGLWANSGIAPNCESIYYAELHNRKARKEIGFNLSPTSPILLSSRKLYIDTKLHPNPEDASHLLLTEAVRQIRSITD